VNVAIVGVGIHPFGRFDGVTGLDLGAYAVRQALRDAGIEWRDAQFAFGGTLAGLLPGSDESVQADQLVNLLGLTGVPFTNVHNGCATAGSALAMGAAAIESGEHDIGVCVGFDRHARGHFNATPEHSGLPHWYGDLGFMVTTQFFAMKINRYMHDFGITRETLARVAAKNYRNGALNPNAWRRKPLSEQEILESRMLNYPLTRYMFCSPDEGAVAVVMCRADHARRYTDRPVFLRAVTARTREFGSFEVFAPWLAVDRGKSPTVAAAAACFATAGVAPADVAVAQLQDSESGAEIMHMAETGLCADGEQEVLVARGETEIGGRLPINTDGGLIANGEPIGASGMRQVHEIVVQLRGDAGERQVPGAWKGAGFTQVYGAPGVSCCTVLTT
jgi:acetyl-CoA acetyltransferase